MIPTSLCIDHIIPGNEEVATKFKVFLPTLSVIQMDTSFANVYSVIKCKDHRKVDSSHVNISGRLHPFS